MGCALELLAKLNLSSLHHFCPAYQHTQQVRAEWKEAGTEQADGPRTESYGIQLGEHMQKWKGTTRELQGAMAGEATLGAGAPVRR